MFSVYTVMANAQRIAARVVLNDTINTVRVKVTVPEAYYVDLHHVTFHARQSDQKTQRL